MTESHMGPRTPSSNGPEYDSAVAEIEARSGIIVLALAIAALIVIGVAAFFSDTLSPPDAAGPLACASIADPEARLGCYDATAHHVPPQPARGATAILK